MSDFAVLESVLRPLSYWYNQDNLEEVAVNCAGEIWLRMRGKRAYPWVMYKDEKLSKAYLTDLLYIIANTYEMPFDPLEGSPFVYATIPGDHRFSAICGRNVMYDERDLTGGIALTIRLHKDDVAFGLEDYGMKQGQALQKLNPLKDIKVPDDAYERLLLYIKRGEHILVSGATSTGKTTFLNNLLKILDIHKRIITVEDTRELIVPHPNRVHLVMSRTSQTNDIDYSGIIDLVVRFTPDAIIGGEISTSNASGIWQLMGSGHDNCFATIHAESSQEAYLQFIKRIMASTNGAVNVEQTLDEMQRKLHVVQIQRMGNTRAITEVT